MLNITAQNNFANSNINSYKIKFNNYDGIFDGYEVKKIGKNQFFCVGDNIFNSYDSRNYGLINFESVVGLIRKK